VVVVKRTESEVLGGACGVRAEGTAATPGCGADRSAGGTSWSVVSMKKGRDGVDRDLAVRQLKRISVSRLYVTIPKIVFPMYPNGRMRWSAVRIQHQTGAPIGARQIRRL